MTAPKPCKECSSIWLDSDCSRCEKTRKQRAWSATYRAKHPERMAKFRADYRESNREQLRAKGVEYHALHQEEISHKKSIYRQQNQTVRAKTKADSHARHRGRDRAHTNKRKAILRSVEINDLTPQDWVDLVIEHDGCCTYCGTREHMTMDHVIPLARGGNHTKSNVVPSCQFCNKSKYTKTVEEFFAYVLEHPRHKAYDASRARSMVA